LKAVFVVAVVALLGHVPAIGQPYPREFGPVVHMEDWPHKVPTEARERVTKVKDQIHDIVYGIAQYTNVNPIVLIRNDGRFNAAAITHDRQEFLILNLGALTVLKDRDAFAFLVAHELAHHEKRHTTEGQAVNSALVGVGQLLGIVLDALAARRGYDTGDMGSAVGRGVGTLVALKYSREQEFEADEMAIGLMTRAGFNPQGAVRLQEMMLAQQGDLSFTFFATHPPTSERLERVKQAALTIDGQAQSDGIGGSSAVARRSTPFSKLKDEVDHCNSLNLTLPALQTCLAGANSRNAPVVEAATSTTFVRDSTQILEGEIADCTKLNLSAAALRTCVSSAQARHAERSGVPTTQ
jgi:hypothetical protein